MPSQKRQLTKEEIEDLLVDLRSSHPENFVDENVKETVRRQCQEIEVYPEVIPALKEEIRKHFYISFVHPGDMVGCIASTSIGEGQTQSSLNSFHSVEYHTRIVIYQKSLPYVYSIGQWIDSYIDEHQEDIKRYTYSGLVETPSSTPFVEVISVRQENWWVSSVDKEGHVVLKQITELVRHPLYTELIKVKTKSGREVTATLGESFLVWKEGTLKPTYGKDIKLNDSLPVAFHMSQLSVFEHDIDPHNYTIQNDVFLDPIVSIELVNVEENEQPYWVYDLTVEDTKSFLLENRLGMYDSSGQLKLNLTSGISRLNELLAATKNPKTLSLTIYFDPALGDKRKDLLFIRQICYSELECVTIQDLLHEYTIDYKPRLDWWYPYFNTFYSTRYQECNFRLRLRLNQQVLWKTKKTLLHMVTQIEKVLKGKQTIYYAFSDELTGIIDLWIDEGTLDDPEDIVQLKGLEPFEQRRVLEYVHTENKALFFIRHVLLPQVVKVQVSGLQGLSKCYIQQEKDNTYYVMTKGGILKHLLRCSYIDPLRSYTNNMWEMFALFGIEATVQFLINEFKMMNENLSRRHLDLLVDWMCSTGTIISVSRYGIDKEKIGPFAKASFEQPLEQFLKAAATGQTEVITGVSAAIATGNLAKMGTGTFDLLMDIDKLQEKEKEERKVMKKVSTFSDLMDEMISYWDQDFTNEMGYTGLQKMDYDDIQDEWVQETEICEGEEEGVVMEDDGGF